MWKALWKAPGLEEGLQAGPCGQRVTSRSTQGGGKGRGQPMQGLVGHGQIQKFNSNVKRRPLKSVKKGNDRTRLASLKALLGGGRGLAEKGWSGRGEAELGSDSRDVEMEQRPGSLGVGRGERRHSPPLLWHPRSCLDCRGRGEPPMLLWGACPSQGTASRSDTATVQHGLSRTSQVRAMGC